VNSFVAETLLDQSHLAFGPQHIGLTYKSAMGLRRIWSFIERGFECGVKI
jgi:hypothetical protein